MPALDRLAAPFGSDVLVKSRLRLYSVREFVVLNHGRASRETLVRNVPVVRIAGEQALERCHVLAGNDGDGVGYHRLQHLGR